MKKQSKNKIKSKFDWILYFAIIGWSLIVAIWVFQATRYFIKNDLVEGFIYLVIGLIFLFIGIKTTKSYLNKKKTKSKK